MDHIVLLEHRKIKAQGPWHDIVTELSKVYAVEKSNQKEEPVLSYSSSADEATWNKARVMQDVASDLCKTLRGEGVYRQSTQSNAEFRSTENT
jgi:hypothetical protein